MNLNDNEIIANGNLHQLRNRLRQRSQELNSLAYVVARALSIPTDDVSLEELVERMGHVADAAVAVRTYLDIFPNGSPK